MFEPAPRGESVRPPGRAAGESPSRWLDRLDPRARIIVAVPFLVVVAVAGRPLVLVLGLALAILAALAGGWTMRQLFVRLLPVNLFVLVLVIVLPWTTGGTPLGSWGGWEFTREGMQTALAIGLRANALVLGLAALVGGLPVPVLGHALAHLRLPRKLIHLLLFAVRYVDVLRGQQRQLVRAMKVRGFRPRMDRHTYRSYGYLVGMLLVRSLDRSERIVAAMKCRGFRGEFHILDHFAAGRLDGLFGLLATAILVLLAWLEWGAVLGLDTW